MKWNVNLWKVIIPVMLIITGCSKDDDPKDENVYTSFEQVLKQGGEFEEAPPARTEEAVSGGTTEEQDIEVENNGVVQTERWICTKQTYRVTDGNSNFPLFNTNADVIYPGNLLQGKTLTDATPAPIVVKRAGGTISYDLNNGNLSSSFTVDEVKKSTIQDAMNTIIDGSNDVVPANFTLEIEQVQSQEQLALEVGVKFDTWTASGAANMQFSSDKQYNRFLVKLNQSYYTMSFDLPTSLDELFHESVTPQQLSQFAGTDNPPTFISSVTYGRIFYMLIESTSSAQEMNSKLNLSYSAFKNSVEGEVEVETFKSLKNLRIKVIAYGGDSKGSISMAGETTVEDIVNRLEESTNIQAGSPISYVVRSVERPDQIVRTKLSTEYDVVNCELKGTLPPASFSSLVDLFKDDGNGGGIGAASQVSQSNIVLYNKAGTKYAWYNGNSGEVLGIFDITDESGPLGATNLESIGAALRFTDKKIYMFDSTGLKCQIFDYDPAPYTGNSVPAQPIGNYQNKIYFVNEIFGDSENFQFIGQGFAAAVRYWKNVNYGFLTYPIMHFFRNPGDKYADYRPIGNGVWINPRNVNEWGNGGIVFEKIGAACRMEFVSMSNTLQLFFNAEGDEFQTWRPSTGEFSPPYVIN